MRRSIIRSLALSSFTRSSVIRVWRWWSIAVIGIAIASCKHPIEIESAHADAADLVIRQSGSEGTIIARTIGNDRWEGNLDLVQGDERHIRITLIDFKGVEFSLDERDDIEIRMEAEQPAMVQWEPWQGYGILRGFVVGQTRVRFLVWHGSHPDFITPWLPLVVRHTPAGPSME